MAGSTETRQERKERYHAVLRAVEHNTTPEQLPGVRPATVRLHLACHGPWDADGIQSALRAAIEQDDLLVWRDADGQKRVTRRRKEDLQRLSEYVGEHVPADMEESASVGRINAVIAEVRDGE